MALIQCRDCGATISDRANACPKCGAPIQSPTCYSQQMTPVYAQITNNTQQYYRTQTSQDESNTGLNILSFLFPWAGWILYFVYKPESPKKAKGCLKWAWLGVACGVILTILFVCLLIYSDDFAEGFMEGYYSSSY